MRPVLVILAALVCACADVETASAPAPSASAASAAATASTEAAEVASSSSAAPPRVASAPLDLGGFRVHDDDADAKAPASSASERRPVGSLKDWLAAYQGSSAPENKEPPRLGTLADLPSLPAGAVVFSRAGHLIRVELPKGGETQLTAGASSNVQPRFTRDGRGLFFMSNRDGGVYRVHRMGADGSGLVAVTKRLPNWAVTSWDVSDDGSSIAYVAPIGDGVDRALHLVDVQSGDDSEIHRGISLQYPSFARDGKVLFFVEGWLGPPSVYPDSPLGIRRVDLSSREVKRLPNPGYGEITKPWDLGEGRVIFAASLDFGMTTRAPKLFQMPAAGGAWQSFGVATSSLGGSISFAPSPDRKRFAYALTTSPTGDGTTTFTDTIVETIDEGSPRKLTAAFPRPFYAAYDLAWAPDSRHAALELEFCPYMGCKPAFRSVVLLDTSQKEPKLAFVGYGSSPAYVPVAGALPPARDARKD